MEYRPRAEKRARIGLENSFRSMDRERRGKELFLKRMKQKPKEGKRAEFLEKYKKIGYDKAKKEINDGFKNPPYNDEVLKKWIEESER